MGWVTSLTTWGPVVKRPDPMDPVRLILEHKGQIDVYRGMPGKGEEGLTKSYSSPLSHMKSSSDMVT